MTGPRTSFDWGALVATGAIVLALFTGIITVKVDIATLQQSFADNHVEQQLFRQDMRDALAQIKDTLHSYKLALNAQ